MQQLTHTLSTKVARALGEKCKFADSEIALAVCDYFARGPMKVIAPHPVLQKKVSKKVGSRREKQSPANCQRLCVIGRSKSTKQLKFPHGEARKRFSLFQLEFQLLTMRKVIEKEQYARP